MLCRKEIDEEIGNGVAGVELCDVIRSAAMLLTVRMCGTRRDTHEITIKLDPIRMDMTKQLQLAYRGKVIRKDITVCKPSIGMVAENDIDGTRLN